MRNVCRFCLAIGMVGCAGAGATTPAPQPPPQAPIASEDTAPAPPAPATASVGPAPSLSDKEQATVKEIFDALSAHDAKKVASMYTDDGIWKVPAFPDTVGHDAMVASLQGLYESFPDLKLAVRRIFLKDDVAIVEFTEAGTNTGTGLGGGKGTGKPFGLEGASVLRFAPDGRVKEEHEYADALTLFRQIGLSKDPPRALVALPTEAPEVHVSKGTDDEDKKVARARAIQRMFETHDVSGFADSMGDGAVWDDLTSPAPANGKEAIVTTFKVFAKAIPDLNLRCDTWAFDDYVVEECAMNGTDKGPLVAPNGKQAAATNGAVMIHDVSVSQITDGKAVRTTRYGNGMELAGQLGAKKAHASAHPDATK
jgi:steroid delta-isomerase-like uncharacterized protein